MGKEMTQAAAPNLATSLIVIHQVITRGLEVSCANAEAFAARGLPDGATQQGFLNYARALCAVVHGHHLAEDDVAFPALRERLPGAPYARLSREHRQIEKVLREIGDLVDRFAAQAAPEPLRALSAALSGLQELWLPHYQTEERHFSVEALGRLLTPEEHVAWIGRMGGYSLQHSKPDFLVVPFLLYNLRSPVRAALAAGMPQEVTEHLVPVVWKDQWASMKPFLLQ
jgi:hypothetical protein